MSIEKDEIIKREKEKNGKEQNTNYNNPTITASIKNLKIYIHHLLFLPC
jgi:hypothetical protein